jgi:serine/threonine protein phosphatase PrpC
MTWQFTSAQSLGAQTEQQDCLGAWPSADGRKIFVVLADGAGGHHGGQEAAQVAVETARALWASNPPAMNHAGTFLERISRAAHEAVAVLSHSPRTTWLALIADDSQAAWVHSGDSRLYHFASGRLALRTLDHSLVQVLVEKGKVNESDANAHPDRSVLLQSLGGPDFIPVEHGSSPVGEDDVFILCTDGVWSALEDTHLLNLARSAPANRQRAAEELIATAVHGRGKNADNASLGMVARG